MTAPSVVVSIINAVESILKAGTPVAQRTLRIAANPIPTGVNFAVDIRPLHAEVKQTQFNPGMPISWEVPFTVACYARVDSTQAADQAVDALVLDVYARLLADTTLGGVCINLAPRHVAYDFDTDAQQTVCATLTFTALQRAGASTFTP